MAGTFEVFVDRQEAHFRFRLKAPDGTVVAESAAFSDKPAAVAGIAAVRECAGMGPATDLCPEDGMQSGMLPAEARGLPPAAARVPVPPGLPGATTSTPEQGQPDGRPPPSGGPARHRPVNQ